MRYDGACVFWLGGACGGPRAAGWRAMDRTTTCTAPRPAWTRHERNCFDGAGAVPVPLRGAVGTSVAN